MNHKRHYGCLNQESTTTPTPLPSIPVFFPTESQKHLREEREQRADSYTPRLHPDKQAGCDCSAHLGLQAGKQSQALRFRYTSMPQRLLWAWNCPVAGYKAQTTDCVRPTPFSIGIALCCCIDKLTVGAWACGFSYCCWGNFPGSDLQWPPDLAGQGQGHCAAEVEAGRSKGKYNSYHKKASWQSLLLLYVMLLVFLYRLKATSETGGRINSARCWTNPEWPSTLVGYRYKPGSCKGKSLKLQYLLVHFFAITSFTYLKIRELEKRSNQERLESARNRVAQAYKLWFYRVNQVLGVMQTIINKSRQEGEVGNKFQRIMTLDQVIKKSLHACPWNHRLHSLFRSSRSL